MKQVFKKIIIFGVVAALAAAIGCSDPKPEADPVFILKTQVMGLTRDDFSDELDLKRAAYPYNFHEYPAEYNEMVMQLTQMLSEELVLLSAAADKGIVVSSEAVKAAETEFRRDYPEDSFEQMLLENAISYMFWKKRFTNNMIMEKLIDQELKARIEIKPQDIVEFYKTYDRSAGLTADEPTGNEEKVNYEQELVKQLRMQKTQQAYDSWLKELSENYPVEINNRELKTFLIDIEK
jgi:hypothetical protein